MTNPINAMTPPIEVIEASATSEFPNGIRFKVKATSTSNIESIAVRFKIGLINTGIYEYLSYAPSDTVEAELFYPTNTLAGYIPPETIIRYTFEIQDSNQNVYSTEPQDLIYEDARFEWERISQDPVSVAFHGPIKSRAESLLQVIIDTLKTMGPILGANTDEPIRVTLYNNQKEMLDALPTGSAAVGRELITEGMAFNEEGSLVILGGGAMANGTASHEVTHILNHRAGHSIFRRIPSWLHEGLAEYGNVEPGYSYSYALEFAVAADRLLPHLFMQTLPGDPEDIIIFYGQSRSIVEYMIFLKGNEGMRKLLKLHQDGTNMDDALVSIYGMDRLGLTNSWRKALGTTQYEPPNIAESKPTAVSYPTVEAFTLTPKAGGMTVSDSINDNKSIDSQPPAGSCNSRSDNGSDVGLLSMFLFIAALSSQTFRRKL
ncbi:MAG: Peptidase MA superfamily protein [Chloroflexi bacterium]|jgi:hypothetical protein|nr:MAG: Peptidase MA superfamily protein [Chloroflexota bacterium]